LGDGLPPFNVRNADLINQNLAYMTLPESFIAVPVVTFIDSEVYDDANYNGCKWVHEV